VHIHTKRRQQGFPAPAEQNQSRAGVRAPSLCQIVEIRHAKRHDDRFDRPLIVRGGTYGQRDHVARTDVPNHPVEGVEQKDLAGVRCGRSVDRAFDRADVAQVGVVRVGIAGPVAQKKNDRTDLLRVAEETHELVVKAPRRLEARTAASGCGQRASEGAQFFVVDERGR